MDLDISKLHFNARPKIYIASSWKNAGLVRTLSLVMQGLGHEVYDFTDAEKHFAFDAADIERFAGKRDEIDWLDFMECTETLKDRELAEIVQRVMQAEISRRRLREERQGR